MAHCSFWKIPWKAIISFLSYQTVNFPLLFCLPWPIILFGLVIKVSYELVSVGNPVQVICRAESFNMTVSPVSSVVNKATSRVSGTSVTAASLTSVPLATASVTAGGTRKRRSVDVVSPDRVVRQYFFNNSAGNEMFSTILHVVYCTQLFLTKSCQKLKMSWCHLSPSTPEAKKI